MKKLHVNSVDAVSKEDSGSGKQELNKNRYNVQARVLWDTILTM